MEREIETAINECLKLLLEGVVEQHTFSVVISSTGFF